MNVYLLPHHRLDPRFRYTLEREAPVAEVAPRDALPPTASWWTRTWASIKQVIRRLRHDYDHVVHGHEQIRLSRLVLLMDRDPELTLVIPAGMTRQWALQAVRGVIRAGLMGHRSHAIRNVLTAIVMMIVLFGIVPTHFAAVIFYPLIGLYAWRRYWEDRLIRRTMSHLLEVRLAGNGGEYFREEEHLARLEDSFARVARPELAYREAIAYLDSLDQKLDGMSTPEHTLMFNYYSDIGQLDPYERYQDRIRKKLLESLKLVIHHLFHFWKGAFRWAFSRTALGRVHMPNWLLVVALLSLVNLALWGTLYLRSRADGRSPTSVSEPRQG